jgi:hypothetical protein
VSLPHRDISSDLLSVIDELTRTEQEANGLVAGLTDAQLNWQPNNGNGWSIAQCLDHLARINTTYTAALRNAVSGANPRKVPRRGPIRHGWFSRFFIRAMDAPPRQKFSAPSQATPSSHIGGEEALTSFVKSHDEVRKLVLDSADMDLNSIRFKNPFVRLLFFTVGTGVLIILAHDRRHLWQAKAVRDALPAKPIMANRHMSQR